MAIAQFRALLPRLLIVAPLALCAGCSGPDEYTCADAIDTTVYVSPQSPLEVDTAQPEKPPVVDLSAVLQVSCKMLADKLEIASAAIVDFDTEAKVLDLSLRFAGGVEGTPTCDGVGTSTRVDVLVEGLTNGALVEHCGRPDLALKTVIKRAGCAATDATRVSKSDLKVHCP